MKFLADENFPLTLVSWLQKKGHNVKRIGRGTLRGFSDTYLIVLAKKEKRILLTFDKEFLRSEKTAGQINVVVFNFPKTASSAIIPYLDPLVKKITSLARRKKNFLVLLTKEGLEIL